MRQTRQGTFLAALALGVAMFAAGCRCDRACGGALDDDSGGPGSDSVPGFDSATGSDSVPGFDSGTDSAPTGTDSTPGADSGPTSTDALPVGTPCGTMTCDSATEICVERGPLGPTYTYTCESVPTACVSDRSCACAGATFCMGAFDSCIDGPTGDNFITCECPACQ